MQKKLLLFILLLSCSVIAENLNPEYLKDFTISQPCRRNGADCPNTVSCDLTTWYPNMSILFSNVQMSYNAGYFSYNVVGGNFSTIGTYNNAMTCNDSVYNATYIFDLDVTKKQILSTDTNFVSETKIITILISLIMIFLGLGVFFSIRDANLKYLFFILAILTIDALTYFGYTITNAISSPFTNTMYRFYYIMLVITFLIVILMLVDLTRKHLATKKMKERYAKDYYGDLNRNV